MRSKALLLLFIFLLNTVTGFSCALRMSHEEHHETTEHHGDQHPKAVLTHHHLSGETAISENDPCCQGAVNSFISLAKVVPPSGQILVQTPCTFINSFFHFPLKASAYTLAVRPLRIDERRRPPTENIRIAIQSFQI